MVSFAILSQWTHAAHYSIVFISLRKPTSIFVYATDLKNTTKRKPESTHHFWFSVSAAYRPSLSHHLYHRLFIYYYFYRRTEFISRMIKIFFALDHVESRGLSTIRTAVQRLNRTKKDAEKKINNNNATTHNSHGSPQ